MIQYRALAKLRLRSRVLIRKRASVACRERKTERREKAELCEKTRKESRNEGETIETKIKCEFVRSERKQGGKARVTGKK